MSLRADQERSYCHPPQLQVCMITKHGIKAIKTNRRLRPHWDMPRTRGELTSAVRTVNRTWLFPSDSQYKHSLSCCHHLTCRVVSRCSLLNPPIRPDGGRTTGPHALYLGKITFNPIIILLSGQPVWYPLRRYTHISPDLTTVISPTPYKRRGKLRGSKLVLCGQTSFLPSEPLPLL